MTDPNVRAQYEAAVAQLAQAAALKLGAGVPEEAVARWVAVERDALKQAFRARTPAPVLARIVARTVARYGNEVGPSVDDLRTAGKSWREIIQSATRAGEHDEDFFQGSP